MNNVRNIGLGILSADFLLNLNPPIFFLLIVTPPMQEGHQLLATIGGPDLRRPILGKKAKFHWRYPISKRCARKQLLSSTKINERMIDLRQKAIRKHDMI